MGALGIAAVGIPSSYYFLSEIEYDPLTATPTSLSLIWDDATIVDIGRKYLSQVPSESGTRTLVGLLEIEGQKAGDELQLLMEAKIKDDFDGARTVLVDGWILSATEARQCALYSMKQTK